jgi:hypothetical protein
LFVCLLRTQIVHDRFVDHDVRFSVQRSVLRSAGMLRGVYW